ncbi:MAG: alpha/beta-hydrolase family protein [Wenzhouxiangella sp.]|nr:alpha/beta-hydrolase family protein [Wenzhouxiangella sp.]
MLKKSIMKGAHLDPLDRFRLSLSTTGLLVATLFFATSLSPSLVPRPFMMQALLSGVALAAGYAVGVFLHWLWHFMELPELRDRVLLISKIIAWLLCVTVAIAFLVRASAWQNSVRELMNMAPVETARPFSVGLVAVLVFVFLLAIARLFLFIKRSVARHVDRVVPTRISLVIGALVALLLFWGVISGVLARFALNSFDASFQQLDLLIEDELDPPSDPRHSGSEASLLAWDDLGRQGRRFIAGTPSGEELARTSPGPVMEPIRIYAGLNSGESIEQRAALALAEMERVGAFERDYLVVITPTGTGWVDPGGIRSLEYLVGGNIASVAMQYSYLPSWLSLLAQAEYGQETARILFDLVYRRWRELPADSRPRLYLHGLSLGALNSERSADIWDLVGDPIDGALWSGPPFRSRTWQWATEQRNTGSPAWLPRFRDGSVIRFANQHGGLDDFAAPWGPFRVVYLQYASDPISFFSPSALYREPAWMRGQRGPDVSPKLRWYPIVTFLQLAADIAAAEVAPIGYGHAYATEHYIDAWQAIIEAPGWDDDRLQRLKQKIGDLQGE